MAALTLKPQAQATQHAWQTWYASLQDHMAIHAYPLLAITLACTLGQIATLAQLPIIGLTDDSTSYLYVANNIINHCLFFDDIRTPGYPSFLALIFWIMHSNNLEPVVIVQSALMTITTFECYVIGYWIFHRRLIATGIAVLLGTNLYFLDWEHSIGSEALSLFLIVTSFVFVTRYLITLHQPLLIWLGLVSALAILTRPFFVYLPLLIFTLLLLYHLRRGSLRTAIISLIVTLFLTYSCISAWMAGNWITTGYFGLSAVGSVNTFGKVLEYHMEGESNDPNFTQMRTDLSSYIIKSREPWGFLNRYPLYQESHYAMPGDFASNIIQHHLVEFALNTWGDIVKTADATPALYTPFPNLDQDWVQILKNCAYAQLCFFPLLPLFLIWYGWRAWKQYDPTSVALLLIGCSLMMAILTTAAASYSYATSEGVINQFYRLRSPMDWGMLFLLADGLRAVLANRSHAISSKR
jgi:Dolichyl-phosphate-mannose-protein mannosyltransferase